jgi:diguanylate cyclase (GGDEF)-like protein
VLVLHAGETGFFDADEMKLLTELAGDISFALEHIQKSEKIDFLAYYDQLTGLANRTLFQERLEQQLVEARANGASLGLLLMNIERFKRLNDALGRQAGDDLLRQVAGRLIDAKKEPGKLARLGGDVFGVMVVNLKDAEEMARRTGQLIEQLFGAPLHLGGTELRASARFGIAMFPDDGGDAETLFTNAEAALKKARSSGERYLFYTQKMTRRVSERLLLENKLREAIEKEQFVLHYQPKVDLGTRAIAGIEALIRWQSPELGLVPPIKFIPQLEETGLILQVGAWALRRAVMDHKDWADQGFDAPRVAVNVSPIQLRRPDFVATLKEAIAAGASPHGLDLEITESLIMEDIEGSIEKLKAARELGIRISIDDFGTGYSSLAYLAKLPVQTLKIDRAFIITMLNDPNVTMLVQTMISLAHSLRLKVVAEGVEEEEQARMLHLLGCEQMQGYLFSKPLPVAELTKLLQQGSGLNPPA